MEAKDTVLSNGRLLEIFGTPNFTEIQGRKKQAEISFKAGRQEVVDFVERLQKSEAASMSWNFRQRWEAKVKEWEVSPVLTLKGEMK